MQFSSQKDHMMLGSGLTHLIPCVFQLAVVLVKHHPECEQSHDKSVTQVPKHHSKQEGECDERKRSCKPGGRDNVPYKQNIFHLSLKTKLEVN